MLKLLYFIAAFCFFFLRHTSAANYSSTCSSVGCGNGVPIRYPFWVNNNSAQEYCGYPDFGLKCSDNGRPIFSLPSDTYYVTDINYDTYKLILVDIDVVNQECPRARHNVSLGNFPLSVDYWLNVNLSFYFNCSLSSYNNVDHTLNTIGCLRNEASKESYVSETTYGLNMDCEEKVIVVVKEEEIRRSDFDLVTGFGEAMNKGFVLDWRKAMDCAKCEDSEGLCGGYTQTNNQTLCFCSDGSTSTKSCSKGIAFL